MLDELGIAAATSSAEWRVDDERRLRRAVGDLSPATEAKVCGALDENSRRFVESSPYVCLGTADAAGHMDVSPRGDDPGFVRVVDDQTLLVPERPGNRLADTLTNLLERPAIGMLFLVPDCPELLRVNGTAEIHDGPPELLDALVARGRAPKLVIRVRIAEVFMHCGRAATRARLWDSAAPHRDPRPDLLVGGVYGLDEAAARKLLADYNVSEL